MADRITIEAPKLIAAHPDAPAVVDAAHVRGLTLSPEFVAVIERLKAPEVIYWLAKPENSSLAYKLRGMSAADQIGEIPDIRERIARDRSLDDPEPDDYIRRRQQEKRERFKR